MPEFYRLTCLPPFVFNMTSQRQAVRSIGKMSLEDGLPKVAA